MVIRPITRHKQNEKKQFSEPKKEKWKNKKQFSEKISEPLTFLLIPPPCLVWDGLIILTRFKSAKHIYNLSLSLCFCQQNSAIWYWRYELFSSSSRLYYLLISSTVLKIGTLEWLDSFIEPSLIAGSPLILATQKWKKTHILFLLFIQCQLKTHMGESGSFSRTTKRSEETTVTNGPVQPLPIKVLYHLIWLSCFWCTLFGQLENFLSFFCSKL